MRGYWGICLYQPKNEYNWGTVLRTAHNFQADFIFTIDNRYKKQSSDTGNATKHIPIFHFDTIDNFLAAAPIECQLVCLEVGQKRNLENFCHPERAIYVFGGEDRTIPNKLIEFPRSISLTIQTNHCLNLAVAAGIVMYDRHQKLLI